MYDARTNLFTQVVENVKRKTCNRTSIRRLFLEISDWLKHQVMVCRLICMIQSLQEQAHIRDWRMKL